MNAQVWLKNRYHHSIVNDTRIDSVESGTSPFLRSNENETVRTYRVGGARGAIVAKKSYYIMADVIISFLLTKEEVSLVELIHYIEELNVKFRENTSWLLLQVKQDLEQKGFIKSSLKDKSPQIILMRKAFLKSDLRKELILQINDESRISNFF